MFGIGFTEILLIAVIAILFLGPDKLPEAMVQIAKLVKSVKQTLNEAKSSLEEEMHISQLKEEALSYKRELDKTTSELRGFKNIELDEILDEPVVVEEEKVPSEIQSPYADERPAKPAPQPAAEADAAPAEPKTERVTLKKRERTFKTLDEDENGEDKA
jgi:sec-independent protein translocase protein TatB